MTMPVWLGVLFFVWYVLVVIMVSGLLSFLVACLVVRFLTSFWPKGERHIVVLVLGDVGRSPRMQYHCLSLADLPARVSLVGYKGETCVPALQENPRIHEHLITPLAFTRSWPRVIGMPSRVLLQMAQLLKILLFELPDMDAVLMQNPPAIPAMLVALLTGLVRNCRVVVDWHNFGYTILSMSLASGEKHPLVHFHLAYERILGRYCHSSLCVTKAMQRWLLENWDIKAEVLYDRAPAFFRKQTEAEARVLFTRLEKKYPVFSRMLCDGPKPALIVSATSWTVDEDFGMLLAAIEALDQREGPPLVFAITGKGPQKAYYEQKIALMSLRRCEIVTAWLAASDYPRLLGSATLGVSLHTSSSGLDLPMKVVDMFGAGLPACALGFQCLDELVVHGHNGMVFDSASELTEQLDDLLCEYPKKTAKLDVLRKGVRDFQQVRWQDNWSKNAAPLFSSTE